MHLQLAKNKGLLFLLIFSGIYLAIGIDFGINIYDEGVAYVGASQFLNCEMPYSDFWTLYAPGQFFLNALSIKIVGYNLIYLRLFSLIIQLGIVAFSYLLVNKFYSKNSLLAGVSVAILLGGFDLWGRSILTSIFLSLVAIYCYKTGIDTNNKINFYYAFIFLTLNIIFRHILGFATAMMFFVAFLILSKKLKLRIQDIVLFLIILVSPTVLIINFLEADPQTIYKLLIYNPLNIFSDFRKLESPFFEFGNFKAFLVSIFMSFSFIIPKSVNFYLLILVFVKNRKLDLLIFFPVLSAFILAANIRSDLEHILPALIVSTIFLSLNNNYKYVRYISILILLALPLKNKISETYTYFNDSRVLKYKYGELYLQTDFAEEYQNIIDYLDKSGKKFYSCGAENDRIVMNDVLIYYLLDKISNNYYFELHPGITTEKVAQEKIVEELKNIDVILALKNKYIEPNKSSIGSKVFILDNYIKNNYQIVLKTNNYLIYERP